MGSMYQDEGRLCTEILRFLLNSCDERCEERVQDVFRRRSKWCGNYGVHNADVLLEVLQDYPQVFEVFEVDGEQYVSPTSQLTVCAAHSRQSGSCRDRACTGLHFCIYYLLSGQCAFAVGGVSRCLFGHSLEGDTHNRRLLQQNYLAGLNLTELRRLFCLPAVRRGVTVPKVCRYYNKHMGCTKGARCRALHLCQPYVLEVCKFGMHCKRNHDINHQQVKQVLTLYGVRVEGRPLSEILREVRDFPRDDNREEGDSCSEDSEDYYEERGRARQAAQPPAFRRSMSQPRSSSRATSRTRRASTSAQTPARPVTQKGRESSRSTQQGQDLGELRIRELEAEAARLGVSEQELDWMERSHGRFPNDYRQQLVETILLRRQNQQQQQQQQQNLYCLPNAGVRNPSSASVVTQPESTSEANSIYSDLYRMLTSISLGYEDPGDPPSDPHHFATGRSATEHEMAEDGGSSFSIRNSPRNGESMPPPPQLSSSSPAQQHLFSDSATFAKTVGGGAGMHNARSPGGNSPLRVNAPTYRPSQPHLDSTFAKTAWASGKNDTTTISPDGNSSSKYKAPTYRLSQPHTDSTFAKTAGVSGGNHTVSSTGPESISAYLQRLQQLFDSGTVTSSRAQSLPSHDSALSYLNAAPSLHPDSMDLSAGGLAALRALQDSEKLPHRRAQNSLTHTRSQQLEPRETPRAQLQEAPTPQQLEMPRSRQQEMQRFQQQETREQDEEALLFQQQERPGTQQPRELLRSQSSPADTARFAQQAERLRLQREIEIGRQAEVRLQQLTVGQPTVLTESPCLSLANPSASLDSCKLLTSTPPHALTSEGSASQSAWRQGTGHTGYTRHTGHTGLTGYTGYTRDTGHTGLTGSTGLTGHAEAPSLLHLDPVNASVDSFPSRIPI